MKTLRPGEARRLVQGHTTSQNPTSAQAPSPALLMLFLFLVLGIELLEGMLGPSF